MAAPIVAPISDVRVRGLAEEMVLQGVADEIGLVRHLHLFHDPALMGADGLGAYR